MFGDGTDYIVLLAYFGATGIPLPGDFLQNDGFAILISGSR